MDGDEVDRVIELAVLQPIFPDIGVGDGDLNLRLHKPDIGHEIGNRHLAAQHHLIADNQPRDDTRIFFGEPYRRRDLREVFQPVAAEPDALDDLEPCLGRKRRHLIHPLVDRIGANAIGDLGQLSHILGDLFGGNMGALDQRRLLVAERRVGDT